MDRGFRVLACSVSRRQWMAELLKLCTFILTILTIRNGLVGTKFCLGMWIKQAAAFVLFFEAK